MKYIILLSFICFSFNSFSQLNKDQWLIGGNASFSYVQYGDVRFTSLQLAPSSGYLIADKFAGGIRMNFERTTHYYVQKYRSTDAIIFPFLRYYFLPKVRKVNIFADASYGFGWGNANFFGVQRKYKYTSSNFAFMAGPAIFLNEHTSLELTIAYSYTNRGKIDSIPTNTLQFGVGFQIHLGKH